MRKAARTRKAKSLDKKKHFGELEERDPGRRAREWMRRPAYYNCQAVKLIRTQGRQMEHKDVTQYLRDRGVIRVGQKDAETVQSLEKRSTIAGGKN